MGSFFYVSTYTYCLGYSSHELEIKDCPGGLFSRPHHCVILSSSLHTFQLFIDYGGLIIGDVQETWGSLGARNQQSLNLIFFTWWTVPTRGFSNTGNVCLYLNLHWLTWFDCLYGFEMVSISKISLLYTTEDWLDGRLTGLVVISDRNRKLIRWQDIFEHFDNLESILSW